MSSITCFNIVLDTCSGSVHAVDEVAYDIIEMYEEHSAEEITAKMLEKYADRADAPALIALAERLNNFKFLPGATEMEEVGRCFLENNSDYSLHNDLQDYFDYDGFGSHVAERYDGKFVDSGFVCMDEDCSLEKVLRGTENQAVSYGGMSLC